MFTAASCFGLWLCLLFAKAAPTSNLVISTTSGVFNGQALTANGTERWLGIPYAQSPVGALRFKAPREIQNAPSDVKDAFTFGDACPQPASNLGAPISEDCLFLNVWRPLNTAANAELPVLVWIHGGAYTTGAASNPSTDPTRIIQRSVAVGKPIVFVSINYRLNTFGFLASSHVAPQDLNAGLLDQRAALQFIQKNIDQFGGDSSKVTIWGQSAGAGSVETHFVYPTQEPLFRAGIADSSTGPFKNSPFASQFDKPGLPFARLLAMTGCSDDSEAVACLQKVPFQTLLNISNTMIVNTLNTQLWQPSVGPAGSMIPERASARILRGDFLKLPYIGGTNINEGTTFSSTLKGLNLTGAAQDAAFLNFVTHCVIDNSTLTKDMLDETLRLFPPNDPADGAPHNTGDSLFDRAEAWYTDIMFLAPRRYFFDAAASLMPVFGYYFAELIPGNDPTNGVFHASELELLFGPIPAVASVETDFANQYLDSYLNFIYDLNPGGSWARFNTANKQVLQLQRDNITLIPDNFSTRRTNFLRSAEVLNEFEK